MGKAVFDAFHVDNGEITVVNSHWFDIFSQNIFLCSVKNVQGNDDRYDEKDNCNFDHNSDDDGVDDSDDDGDDDTAGGEEDVNQETKQEQVAVQLGPSRGL